MVTTLRLLFVGILASMVGMTVWASRTCSLFAIPPLVLHHPWFLATLADAVFAFLAFYLWTFWKEPSALARTLWFIAIMLLGNLAIGTYALKELFSISTARDIPLLLSRRNRGSTFLPAFLSTVGVIIYIGSWLQREG